MGVKRVEVENSGLILFLYDACFATSLRKTELAIFDGYAGELADDELGAAGKRGELVVVELPQDDSMRFEIHVGAPPVKLPKHLPVQRARLSCESGRLCIDSYDALRLVDPAADGVTVSVPRGSYVLSLYRLVDADPDVDLIVVLTPAKKRESIDSAGVLRYPAAKKPARKNQPVRKAKPADKAKSQRAVEPARAWQFEDGALVGHVRRFPFESHLNDEFGAFVASFDRKALDKLDAAPEDKLVMTIGKARRPFLLAEDPSDLLGILQGLWERAPMLKTLQDKLVDAMMEGKSEKIVKVRRDMEAAQLRAIGTELTLGGYLVDDRRQRVLAVEPIMQSFDFPLKAGMPVVLGRR